MDAENRIIPIVDDDQGEGWKDLWEDPERLQKAVQEMNKVQAQATKELFDKISKKHGRKP